MAETVEDDTVTPTRFLATRALERAMRAETMLEMHIRQYTTDRQDLIGRFEESKQDRVNWGVGMMEKLDDYRAEFSKDVAGIGTRVDRSISFFLTILGWAGASAFVILVSAIGYMITHFIINAPGIKP